ncbi:hypothetical protein V1505DRAFT_371121 [Lipomyces doorenjongii]
MSAVVMLLLGLIVIHTVGASATVLDVVGSLTDMSIGDSEVVSNNTAVTVNNIQSVEFTDLAPALQQLFLNSTSL